MDEDKLIDEPIVQVYLHKIVGSEGISVALSPVEGEFTDEELAEEIDAELSDVRRALMILNENDLADYRRERDTESGWLTYLWTFEYQRITDQLYEEMHQLHDMLEKRVEYEKKNEFYECEMCSKEYTFEEAMELTFICPKCQIDLKSKDIELRIEAIKSRIKSIEEELNYE